MFQDKTLVAVVYFNVLSITDRMRVDEYSVALFPSHFLPIPAILLLDVFVTILLSRRSKPFPFDCLFISVITRFPSAFSRNIEILYSGKIDVTPTREVSRCLKSYLFFFLKTIKKQQKQSKQWEHLQGL